VAERRGESLTQAVIHAFEEHLERIKGSRRARGEFGEVMKPEAEAPAWAIARD
jgi:hypothetical protein